MRDGSKPPVIFLLIAASIASIFLVPKAHAQVYKLASLARPILVSLSTWQPAIALAQIAGVVGFTDFVIQNMKTDSTGSIGSVQGLSVNTVDIFGSDPVKPVVSVVVDSIAMPKDMPAQWKFDSGSGVTFDPLVNSPPGTVQPSTTRASYTGYVGCSTPQYVNVVNVDLNSLVSTWMSAANSGGCTNSGAADNFYSAGAINYTTGEFTFNCKSPFQNFCGGTANATITSTASGDPNTKPAASVIAPPMWPSDCKCTYQLSGNVFSGHPQDPDCWLGSDRKKGPAPPPPGVTQTPTSVGSNNGQGSSTTVVINPDGSTRITNTVPNGTGSGTIQNVIDLAPPTPLQVGSTYVTGQVQNVYNGTGSQTSSTPAVPTVPISAPVSTPSAALPAASSTPATSATPATTSPVTASTTDFCAANPNSQFCQVATPGDPSQLDGLYTPQTGICATFGCILESMSTKVKASQLWSSTVGFFRSTESSASCGGFNTTINIFGRSIDMNIDSIFCGSTATKVYTSLAIVFIITVSVSAFMIAIL